MGFLGIGVFLVFTGVVALCIQALGGNSQPASHGGHHH
ncbi:hypothetical protein RC1_1373 [Rhodospirillum centenum SW]|uniref:Uncharacterized protein n=1 Tax=Rhodospirillum centenum (strain ATCC 51521 / SW) TaxID=414684 RepID=B6IT19_RHOCS|nr:hypothetical protein RC1_1373 [Rhodospirillum centenum SW]